MASACARARPRAATGSWPPGAAGGPSGSGSCRPRSRPSGPGPHRASCIHSTSGVNSASRAVPVAASLVLPSTGIERAASRCASEARAGSVRQLKTCSSVSSWLAQQFADGRLDQRGREARQRRRHPAQNPLVEHGGLRKVGDLRRSADDGRGRKQKILKDGPQQRRGRDALRLGVENAEQFGGRKALPSGLPESIGLGSAGRLPLQGKPRAALLVDEEEQARLRRHGDLRVIAGRFELPVASRAARDAVRRRARWPRATPARPCDASRGHWRRAPAAPARQRPWSRTPRRPVQRCVPAGRPRPALPSRLKRQAAPRPRRPAQ